MGTMRPSTIRHGPIRNAVLFWELTGVPFVKNSPRAPLGPSDVLIDGMPFSGMAFVRQKSAPASSEICNDQPTKLEGVSFMKLGA